MSFINSRLLNLKHRLDSINTDAIIVQSIENRLYLTGLKTSIGIVLYTINDERYFITDGRYEEVANKELCKLDFNIEVITNNDYLPAINNICKRCNIKSIAFEDEYININQYNDMFENVNCEFTPFSKELLEIRSIKDDLEIENIVKAQKISEVSFKELLNHIKVGMSEKDIQARLTYLLLKNGSDSGNFGICCVSGENSSLVHGVATDKKIGYGDSILLDFGSIYNGYYSDMTRTFCVGEPSDDFVRLYNLVLQSNIEGIKAIKFGRCCSDIDKISRDIISDAGYGKYFNHGLGHGLGIDIHENPRISSSSRDTINVGNIVTVEPGIYIPRKFGIRIEDMVLVKEDGVENLTSMEKDLLII